MVEATVLGHMGNPRGDLGDSGPDDCVGPEGVLVRDGDLMPRGVALGQARATLIYRPVRRLYSIPRDIDLLRQVIRYASRRLGGVLDLIAVEAEPGRWDDFDRACAGSADPDRVIVVGRSAEDERSRFEHLAGATDFEVVTLRSHIYPADAVGPLAADEFVEPVYADPQGTLFAAASWGDPSDSLLDLSSDELLDATVDANPPGEAWAMPPHRILDQAILGATCLDATARGVRLRSGDFVFPYPFAFVAIADPSDIDALTYFWNIRALVTPFRTRVVALPLWEEPDSLEESRANLRRLLGDNAVTEPDVLLYVVRWTDLARAERILTDGLGLTRSLTSRATWNPLASPRPGPLSYLPAKFRLPARELLQIAQSAEYPVVSGDEMRLRIERPDAMPNDTVVEAVDVPELTFPPRRAIAALVAQGTRATAAGLAWQGLSNGELRIKIPSDEAVALALLRDHGVESDTSSWGAAAYRTLDLLGGLNGLEPLATEGALDLLDLLAGRGPYQKSSSGRPSYESMEAMQLSAMTGELGARTRLKTKADVIPILDRLLEAQLVYAGFRIECGRCSARYWRVIDEVASEMICVGCRSALRIDLRSKGEPVWEYRLNEVMIWPLDQGVLPGLLALRRLSQEAAIRPRLLLGREVVADGIDGEIDIVGTVDREVVVAEVKAGAELSAEEVQRTLALADRLRGRAYFVTVAQAWSPTAVGLIEEGSAACPKLQVKRFVRSDLVA